MLKRLFLFCLPGCTLLLLSSCTVNWFDGPHDVPWWTVAIPTVLLFIILAVIARRCFTGKAYICPQCRETFSPAWWRAALTVHLNSNRVFKCPHCGRRGFCRVYKDPED